MATKIGFIVGSLRKASYNRQVAEIVEKMFPEGFEIQWIEIGDLPLYNDDLDNGGEPAPASWQRFRQEAGEADGFLFFTPENNRSMSAAIKNAIDVGSRGENNVWRGKFAGVISATWGAAGGMLANHALRETFTYNDLYDLKQPEVYLGKIQELIHDGKLNEGTQEFIQSFVDAYVEFSKKFTK